jgi:hypothetical protein
VKYDCIFISGQQVKQANSFIYLGSLLTWDGKCDQEIKITITAMTIDAHSKLKTNHYEFHGLWSYNNDIE